MVIKPLVDALFAYLKSNERKASTAKLKQAVTYALNQEKYLRVFLEDGEVPMDNNASERAIRGFCIGKKNWEMIDTINGATSSAIIYSIAETAKANNLKPYEYFEYLLTQIPAHMDDTDRSFLEDLLPWSPKLPEYIRKENDRKRSNPCTYKSPEKFDITIIIQLHKLYYFNKLYNSYNYHKFFRRL